MTKEEDKDVHTEHCCQRHGCKYDDKDCTVLSMRKSQSFPCEICWWHLYDDGGWEHAHELNRMYDKAYARAIADMKKLWKLH